MRMAWVPCQLFWRDLRDGVAEMQMHAETFGASAKVYNHVPKQPFKYRLYHPFKMALAGRDDGAVHGNVTRVSLLQGLNGD